MEEELEKKPSSLVTLCRWSSVVLDGQETNDLAPKGPPEKPSAGLIKSEGDGEADRNANGNGDGDGDGGGEANSGAGGGGGDGSADGTNGVQGTDGVGRTTEVASAGNVDDQHQHQNQFQSSQNCPSIEARNESEDCFLIPKGQFLGY